MIPFNRGLMAMRLPVMTLLLPLLAASAVAANVSPPARVRVCRAVGTAARHPQLTGVAAGDIPAARAHDLAADNRVFNWKDTTNVQ